MSTRQTTLAELLLLTAVSLFQAVGAYALDWNKTHTMKFTATKGCSMNSKLRELPSRNGPKPQTEGPAPHRQVAQWPATPAYAKQLHEFAVALPGVTNGTSHMGDGGLSAFFLADVVAQGWSAHFLIDNEFAHIHADGSHSLHLALPHELGLLLAEKGWVEQHPLSEAGNIPNTNFMLFGARNTEELDISKLVLEQSWDFARKQQAGTGPRT